MDNFYLVKSFEIPKYTSVLEKSIVLDKMLFRMEVKMSDQTSLLWVMVHIYIWSVSKNKKTPLLVRRGIEFSNKHFKVKREGERNNKLIFNVNFFFTLLSNFIIIARDLDQFSREYYHKFLLYLFFWHHFESNFIHFYQGLEGFSLLFILKTIVKKYFSCEFLVRIK